MAKIIEGKLDASGLKIGIAVSRFNELISKSLVDGAIDCIKRHGGDEGSVEIAWVPGSFEVPFIAQKLAETKKFNAIICLGAVIRGSTPHFDYVAAESAKGVAVASQKSGVPIIYGILTTDSIEQALERSGSKQGNKGFDAALSAIEMSNLLKQI